MLLRDDPHVDWKRGALEFRLTYGGPLLAETARDGAVRRARADHKHEIRKAFHPQLKRWWEVSPYLRYSEANPNPRGHATRIFARPYPQDSIKELSERYDMFGYKFVPLVTRDLELLCSVDVLFLRLGEPGGLVTRVGDIDNRLKTLFDALAVPRNAAQLGRAMSMNRRDCSKSSAWAGGCGLRGGNSLSFGKNGGRLLYHADGELTVGAVPDMHPKVYSRVRAKSVLQDLLSLFIIASCTKIMRRLAVFHRFLQRIYVGADSNIRKLIASLLVFPVFELHNLLFKIVYSIQSRRLRFSCSQDFFLKFYSYPCPDGSIVDILKSLRNIQHRLERAEASEYLRDHINPPFAKDRL